MASQSAMTILFIWLNSYWIDDCYLKFVKCLWKHLMILLSKILGYGYNMSRVFLLFLILVLAFGLFYYYRSPNFIEFVPITDSASLTDSVEMAFGYSLNNSLGPFEKFSNVVGVWWSGLHSTLGMLLVGFLGFVMANRIRNNV